MWLTIIANFIQGLDEKPAIIGHSMGGLVVQLLLQRDLAVAGVAIDPAPPAGVFTTAFSFLKANFPAINPFLFSQPVMMSFEQFQYAFVNTLPLDEQRAAYDRYASLESRGVPTSSPRRGGQSGFQEAASAAVDHRGREGSYRSGCVEQIKLQ